MKPSRFNRAGLGPQLIPIPSQRIEVDFVRATHRPKPSVARRILQIIVAVARPDEDTSSANVLPRMAIGRSASIMCPTEKRDSGRVT
jgi:hypothetical protein